MIRLLLIEDTPGYANEVKEVGPEYEVTTVKLEDADNILSNGYSPDMLVVGHTADFDATYTLVKQVLQTKKIRGRVALCSKADEIRALEGKGFLTLQNWTRGVNALIRFEEFWSRA